MVKAVVLFSGGLDSSLALEIVKEWGVKVFPLHIAHKFLSSQQLPNVPGLKIIDVTEEFAETVQKPEHGYGKNLNPCIDCRILMLKKAKEYMVEVKADFVVTGEVLEQRQMSQRFDTLMLIEKKAGLEGLVVRPLSGALLPPTHPEIKGLIRRQSMLKIKGRSRRLSLDLAKKKKIEEFFSPSGGCLLTDPGFCRRLADVLRFREEISLADIEFLKIGRHFRMSPTAKLVVGRNEEENGKIEELAQDSHTFLFVPDTGSPNAILIGDRKFIKEAASITARYSDKKKEPEIEVHCKYKGQVKKVVVKPIGDDELEKWRI
ncbi:MAG: tRNA 4-thiouridine(8) synthase ThiI [candidate division WOR-3 bacterium]|nr:MAG: tRNA 4-thiouridine(8) synthase ThiI [candidate division WOR-3 bacterium]